MSYDVSIKLPVKGLEDKYIEVAHLGNITWNVREIITRSTGLEWKNEENNGLCVDVIPKIQQGYNELVKNGAKYKKYESPNGWGTVDGTIYFFKRILDAWDRLVLYDEELVPVATFWVE